MEGNRYKLTGYDYGNLEIASMFTNILGKEIKYIDIDPLDYKQMGMENKTPTWSRTQIIRKIYTRKQR